MVKKKKDHILRKIQFNYPAARTSFQLTITNFITAAHVQGSPVSGSEF